MNLQSSRHINNVSNVSIAIGVLAGIVTFLGARADNKAFASGYLVAYVFWMGITVGSSALVMIHNLVGGGWGMAIRNLLDRSMKNIALMLPLTIPILLNIHELYEWSHTEAIAHDAILQHKIAYLNAPFFTTRMVIYMIVWIVLFIALYHMHDKYDQNLDERLLLKLQRVSGAGLLIYALTVSFFSYDLIMSLEPHWFSTIFGMIYMVSFALSALAIGIVVGVHYEKNQLINENNYTAKRNYELGNLLFGVNLVWVYVCLSQFLIIWSGNLQEETPWYLVRTQGGWLTWIYVIIALHFVVPFLALLLRQVKKSLLALGVIATLIAVMRYVDLYWQIKPALYAQPEVHWLDLSSLVCITGLWIGIFLRFTKQGTLFSLRDGPDHDE